MNIIEQDGLLYLELGPAPRGLDKDMLRAAYVQTIGYDPFKDDPTITVEEVYDTLKQYNHDRRKD